MNDTTTLLPDLKLRFTIDHPNIEECYTDGYEAALAELDEEVNPYKPDSSEYEQWANGWWDGFYGDKPVFDAASEYEVETAFEEIVAANDLNYHAHGGLSLKGSLIATMLKYSGAIAATAYIGYQVLDLVA